MKKSRLFFGLCIAVSLDAAIGIFISHIMGNVSGRYTLYTAPWMYLAGVFFALFPDMDVAIQLFQKNKITGEHKEILHHPILLIGIICGITAMFSIFWAIFIGLCLLAHFVHDTTGDGPGGVMWLSPFSKNTYKLFWEFGGGDRIVLKKWTPEELKQTHLLGLEEWLENFYLKPTGESITGILMLMAAVFLTLLT